MCETQADDYFVLGEDGVVEVLQDDVPDEDTAYVRAATSACPFSALELVD
jgi:ferredoxin